MNIVKNSFLKLTCDIHLKTMKYLAFLFVLFYLNGLIQTDKPSKYEIKNLIPSKIKLTDEQNKILRQIVADLSNGN